MNQILFVVVAFCAVLIAVEAGQPAGQQGNRMARGQRRGQEEDEGWQQERGQQGRSGWQQGGNRGGVDNSKYRTNLYNDDDVYGYDAKYPNGEALYVNYRNSEARSRRGPDFARSNSISARGRSDSQSQPGRQRDSGDRQQADRDW